MHGRSLLREAAAAANGRRPAAASAPEAADPVAAYGAALSVGLAPVLACLAQAAIELLALQSGAPLGSRGRQGERPAETSAEAQ
jgi:hypothetical protein